MYKLDRTRKCRYAALFLAFVSAVMTLWGYAYGGDELLEYGFINQPMACIWMIASAFALVLYLFLFFLIRSIEKDMEENLKSVDENRK